MTPLDYEPRRPGAGGRDSMLIGGIPAACVLFGFWWTLVLSSDAWEFALLFGGGGSFLGVASLRF